ncbi:MULTISPECIES: MutS family DNA mismatch repair protein [Chitinophagaceae]
MKDPKAIYESNICDLTKTETELKKKRSWMAWGRFLLMVLTIGWLYNEWHKGWQIGLLGFIVGVALFLVLVAKDTNLKTHLVFIQKLLVLNKKEIAGLDNQYADWESGSEFMDPAHPYLTDLDIFGKHSLFQYVNRAQSEGGRMLLASFFAKGTDKTTIENRQIAVQVMSTQTEWRQYFQAYGSLSDMKSSIEKDIEIWLQQSVANQSAFWKIMVWTYPLVTLTCLYLYLDNTLSGGAFGLCMIVFILFSFAQSRKNNETFSVLSRFYPKVSVMGDQIACLEKLEGRDSVALQELKKQLAPNQTVKASDALKQLGKILGMFEARLNVFLYFFLNTFLLWDVRVAITLSDWKTKFGDNMYQWLQAIYQADALNSLAALRFNHPEWIFPEIASEYYSLDASCVGHPLIPAEKRVDNDFTITGQGKIALITGSNMGGKSTFLRSLGVNIVLAYAGAPVCARCFKLSVAKLMSSMRIADNLAENTSTFYAELKKIRAIIDAVNAKEKVFVLLDEILRGTNSLDRHAGSKALMLQLIREKAVAVIATHDVELANLVNEQPDAIANYHFDVQVATNDELYFDYKLKSGVCQRMNAAILMKQIGIEI